MLFGMREVGESSEMRMFSQREVEILVQNIRSMELPQGDRFLKVLEDMSFIKLDKLFNGAVN